MKKSEKFTQTFHYENDTMMEVTTCNTRLKRRLTRFASDYPELCRITENDGGRMSFLIDHRRLSYRVTNPYPEERRKAASDLAKSQGIHKRIRKDVSADG